MKTFKHEKQPPSIYPWIEDYLKPVDIWLNGELCRVVGRVVGTDGDSVIYIYIQRPGHTNIEVIMGVQI